MSCNEVFIAQLTENQIGRINNFLYNDTILQKKKKKKSELDVNVTSILDDKENSEDENWEDNHFIENDEKGNEELKDKWIKNTLIGVSLNSEYIVLVNFRKFVVLEKKGNQMNIIVEKDVSEYLDNQNKDFIRCVYVLPISGKGKIDAGHVNWTCIILGLSTGHALFFTETGVIIFKEHISHFAIKRIDFDNSTLPGNQELSFLCKNRLVVFEGKGLLTTLISARSKIAKNEMNVNDISMSLDIPCHVLYLENGLQSEDFQITRPYRPPLFDRLVEGSFSDDGENAIISSKPIPVYSTYITTGGNGWAVFNWWDKDSGRDLITEGIHNVKKIVTEGVASYIPSFGIRSFFGLTSSQTKDVVKKDLPSSIPYSHAPAKCILKDEGRKGERIFKAPEPWDFALICDSIARISLVCTRTNIILKMWKGYRDAKCAFYETYGVMDLDNKKCKTKTLFVIFYLPRRAIIEIWSLRTGKRVGAFHADKNGRLLLVQNQILGCRNDLRSFNKNLSFIYIKPNGMLVTYSIPFSLSLCHELDASTHDKNLICEIRKSLKLKDNEKWFELIKKLQYVENIYKEYLEYIYNENLTLTSKIDITKKLLKEIKDENKKHKISVIMEYLKIYEYFLKVQDENNTNEDVEMINFNLTQDLVNDALLVLNISSNKISKNGKNVIILMEFLKVIELQDQLLLDKFKNFQSYLSFGDLIFNPVLKGIISIDDFINQISKLPFDYFYIMKLFTIYFLSNNNDINYMKIFNFGKSMMKMFLNNISFHEKSSIMSFINGKVLETNNVRNALMLTMILFSISQENENNEENINVLSGWEDIDMQTEALFLTVQHLLILTFISTLPYSPEVSLEKVYQKKYSFYRETLGMWLCQFYDSQSILLSLLTSPEELITHCHVNELYTLPSNLRYNSLSLKDIDQNCWLPSLRNILKYFPLKFLFADVSWECISLWNKSKFKNISKLNSCINSLRILQPYPTIQHGLCLMIWDTFLQSPFKALYDLLNTSGDLPTDRELKKFIGIGETEIIEFVDCIIGLFKCWMKALNVIESASSVKICYEDFFTRFFDFGKNTDNNIIKDTLIEISIKKQPVNYHLILHHYHLSTVISLQLSLSLPTRPRFLFDQIGNRAFFQSLHSHPLITISDVDEQCTKRRQEFMEKAIENFALEDDCYALNYWNTILEISCSWNLNIDALRIKEIFLFYRHSMDLRGEKAMSCLVKHDLLIPSLIPIIAFRIRCLLERNSEIRSILKNQIISLDTALSYIEVLEFDEAEIKDYKPEDLIRLISRLLNIIETENIKNDSTKYLLKSFLEIVSKF
ncbi:Rab3 GTPase-activating protein non-catalytic subunit [Strongyloides ratti]|uniref:Rab3 GTPase-activating protein non-catalytic subunit n=1 Tax=Strongyloides ratti TaxID=34506 RepID=A0A090MXJ8_STRRB|nr:Rab3 GTPase-activating protein non-catalytic subunit [Strongyloides ratti]CEF65559.1 Rab3 GTPase-activating protein non-catalytic subunit [Strongyloides ratti]